MATVFIILGAWLFLSFPVAVLLGRSTWTAREAREQEQAAASSGLGYDEGYARPTYYEQGRALELQTNRQADDPAKRPRY